MPESNRIPEDELDESVIDEMLDDDYGPENNDE